MSESPEAVARRLEALRRNLQAGIDASAAGRVSDGEDVFARLRARFPAGMTLWP